MSQYNSSPDLVWHIQEMGRQQAALAASTQQRSVPMARVTASSFVLTNNVESTVTFNTEVFDTGGMWDAGTPTRLAARARGVYSFVGGAVFASNASAGYRRLRINHSRYGDVPTWDLQQDSVGDLRLLTTDMWPFEPGDYIELMAFESSGANQTVSLSSLCLAYMGPIS